MDIGAWILTHRRGDSKISQQHNVDVRLVAGQLQKWIPVIETRGADERTPRALATHA